MNPILDSITIRRADLHDDDDASAVARMIDDYAADAFGDDRRLPPEVVASLPNGLRSAPGAIALLVEDAGCPVGVAVCFLGFATFSGTSKLNVHDFSISPSHRRRGLGRRLMRAVIDLAAAEGCGKLTLEVRHDNDAAKALYAETGFSPGVTPYEFWTCNLGD
ncbi:MAG: GNAT family N-acetyltransferase [Planctomycetota bacterium]